MIQFFGKISCNFLFTIAETKFLWFSFLENIALFSIYYRENKILMKSVSWTIFSIFYLLNKSLMIQFFGHWVPFSIYYCGKKILTIQFLGKYRSIFYLLSRKSENYLSKNMCRDLGILASYTISKCHNHGIELIDRGSLWASVSSPWRLVPLPTCGLPRTHNASRPPRNEHQQPYRINLKTSWILSLSLKENREHEAFRRYNNDNTKEKRENEASRI